jgi:hypothetical protein
MSPFAPRPFGRESKPAVSRVVVYWQVPWGTGSQPVMANAGRQTP